MIKIIAGIFALIGVLAAPAHAATLVVGSNGKLTGLRSIDYSNTLYDVDFVDGKCADLFSGCDNSSDFIFQSSSAAGGMANFLKNNLILDSVSGLFDSNPALTAGCSISVQCEISIPFGFTPTGDLRVAAFLNGRTDTVIYRSFNRNRDLTIYGEQTFALFRLSSPPTGVPEPSTWIMMLLGFFGLGTVLRNRGADLRCAAVPEQI